MASTKRRPRIIKRLLESGMQIREIFYPDALDRYRLSDSCKVRVLQVGLPVRNSGNFHFQLHHAQSTVVEYNDLDRQIILGHGAPMACGKALAMEPCENEAITRRSFVASM